MTASTKDDLLVLLALLAILGAGFGMGRLVGTPPAPAATPPTVTVDELETRTLLSLRETLDLTPAQEAAILPEIESTTAAVLATREQAVLDFHLKMLALHDQLAPHLNLRQQEILRENRAKLQDSIDQRFDDLLEDPSESSPDPTVPPPSDQ